MIANAKQREITLYWAERFTTALDQLGGSEMPPELRMLQSAALQSMIDELRAEIAAYDAHIAGLS